MKSTASSDALLVCGDSQVFCLYVVEIQPTNVTRQTVGRRQALASRDKDDRYISRGTADRTGRDATGTSRRTAR